MITLASDFGTPYPAAMKGVLCQHTEARLVDVAHDFPRQDVRTAAFWLREVLPYFPPATHLVVVDPGVGTDRAALAIDAGDHQLIAPDNGVAIPAARRLVVQSDEDAFTVYEVPYDDAETASTTFHGRDVFAPAAATVHEAGSPGAVDASVERDDWVDLRFPEPAMDAGGATGEVLVVDGFGNVVTNVPGAFLAGLDSVAVNGEEQPVRAAYAAVATGDRLVTVGSHGFVELAVNQGRGDEAFGVAVGDELVLES
jgi:S-adenosylmethionine hydrolase